MFARTESTSLARLAASRRSHTAASAPAPIILPAPEIQTVSDPANFRVITLEALIGMKLMSNRDKDRTHLHDLIGVGLVDPSWLTKLLPELGERLKQILDTPDA